MYIKFDQSIFRDYDIRGIYPGEINENFTYLFGYAAAKFLKVKEIAVGYDARKSSPSLSKSMIKGITDFGTDVIDLGKISTEMHNFASGFYKFGANIIISASHNPPQYNGIKMLKKNVIPLTGDSGFPEIKNIMLDFQPIKTLKKAKIIKKDIYNDWLKHVLSFIDPKLIKNYKVVLDAGNGMAGLSWNKVTDKIPIRYIKLFFNPDGRFPNHLPDPSSPENLKQIKKEIIKNKADMGFAFDGDADRIFILDEKANIVSGSIVSAMVSEFLLKKFGPANILYNAVCGRIVPETIKRFNGIPIRVRVGHSYIKKYMKDKHALFAGEHSGHFYFRDNYFADSSMVTGLLLLQFFSEKGKKVSEIVRSYDKYRQSGEINFKIRNKEKVLKFLKAKYSKAIKHDNIDGLSVWFNNWWFNIRPSKTEPFLRLNVEADNLKILTNELKKLTDILNSLIKKAE
jgi:phosphomannomutase